MDNLSLAGAEATGLIARDATSDRLKGAAGANIYDARLTDADFRGALLNGVSLNHSRFDGADFRDATWNGVMADTASFRGADLQGLKGVSSSVYLADFTDAKLGGAPLSASDLAWATLCHTLMPDGNPPGSGDRDCRAQTDPGPTPAANPYVVVNASLQHQQGRAVIHATIRWNATAIAFGMSAGDIAQWPSTARPVADHRRLSVDSASLADHVELRRDHHRTDAAVGPQSRQPGRADRYATPAAPQPGEGSDHRQLRHGTRHAAARSRTWAGGQPRLLYLVLSPTSPGPAGYDFCDLPGAVLTQAALSGPMREADLTGADLANAGLKDIVFDGSAMGGLVATGADFNGVSMIAAFAPRLTMPTTL